MCARSKPRNKWQMPSHHQHKQSHRHNTISVLIFVRQVCACGCVWALIWMVLGTRSYFKNKIISIRHPIVEWMMDGFMCQVCSCMRTMYIISLAFPWTIYIDKIKWRNKNGNQNHDELRWSARPSNITFRLIDAYILDLDVLKVVAVRWWLSFIHRTLSNTLRLH